MSGNLEYTLYCRDLKDNYETQRTFHNNNNFLSHSKHIALLGRYNGDKCHIHIFAFISLFSRTNCLPCWTDLFFP